ncbi:MAG TPA: chemotaxis protein CheB [Dokdonella sp.]|uniref:chemotaxis protein CheB n=1 Tax=Dokdonella sp. TaxID=2291710 RepID=UPI002D8079EE|nr:chemotaxis protein CheB [Dokdonella sp.]HET9034310.1 chemotaxis protein CheB [Dokdonella sp.]
MPENTMSIALLSQAGESGRHLRAALADSGTPIVYESSAAELDRDALENSGARVVVVNLDAEVEAHLDDVYALLDDDRYNVIFDESQVSSQLSGWEQARWARHLAAKILGVDNADPPRPEGAEPVPQRVMPTEVPAPVVEAAAVEPSAPEPEPVAVAELNSGSSVETEEIQLAEVQQQQDEKPVEEDDFGDIAKLLADPEFDSIDVPDAEPAPLPAPVELDSASLPMTELDFSEFDDVDESPSPATVSADEVPEAIEVPEFDLDFDLDESVSAAAEDAVADADEVPFAEPVAASVDALGFGDLDDFAGAEDVEIETIELDSILESPGVSVDSDLAESLESGEAAAAGGELAELQLLDLDMSDAPPPAPSEGNGLATEDEKAPIIESAFAWELESTDEDGAGESTAADAEPSKPATFGIEKISASDFLAPEAESVEEYDVEPGLSLELIPLEEAVAPRAESGLGSNAETESWLDTSNKTAISRVWVLGASIGGPEAVREFLAEIPANCPALFLLAQHMGAEFMEIMAQQLVRSTKLIVRTPSHGERVSHGDLLIVPTTHRLRVDRAGVVTLEAQTATERTNLPSIDQVLQDVADRFAAKAGAIIFSGMADDAAEGSRYLTEIGGTVFAQDPETCVISSMVDGVVDTGVVSFIGSPKALAGKLLEVLGSTTKSSGIHDE